jgi:hypothetical protein
MSELGKTLLKGLTENLHSEYFAHELEMARIAHGETLTLDTRQGHTSIDRNMS